MATVKYGLSPEGFKRKRLPEVIQSLNDRVANKLGIQIQTGANSVFGQLHGIYAYEIADLWALAEDTYKSMYPSTAEGDSLSNAAGLAGIAHITAEKTGIVATCYGVDGSMIPYRAQISDGVYTYSCTDTNASISRAKACYAAIKLPADPTVGTVYRLTIDGDSYTHTAVSTDTHSSILIDLYSNFAFTDRTGTVTDDVLIIQMEDETDTMAIDIANLSYVQIGSPVNFYCDTSGAIEPAIGTVVNIPLAYTGWQAVSNNVQASVGRDAETDIALRQRWNSSVYARAIGMVDSISAGIYQNVDGVTSCITYENFTDFTDADGRPPHSIEVVVNGGLESDIAKELMRRKAAGIDTFGDTVVTALDSQEVPHIIRFNRPHEVKIWFKVLLKENPDEELSLSAPQQIAEALLEKGNKQNIGEDVILQRYFATIFSATGGVGYISLKAAVGESPGSSAYSTDNISISPREVAVFDSSRIEVSIDD